MSHYSNSRYAYARVGFVLCCEHEWGDDIMEGDRPKCVHCREEYEYSPENPKPCIERIAQALEDERDQAPDND